MNKTVLIVGLVLLFVANVLYSIGPSSHRLVDLFNAFAAGALFTSIIVITIDRS